MEKRWLPDGCPPGETAAVELVRQLAGAREQVAREMAANLRHLRAVLKETERIAGDMEAILREACTPVAALDRGRAAGHPEGKRSGDGERQRPAH